mgnify:CR=1 FL=1
MVQSWLKGQKKEILLLFILNPWYLEVLNLEAHKKEHSRLYMQKQILQLIKYDNAQATKQEDLPAEHAAFFNIGFGETEPTLPSSTEFMAPKKTVKFGDQLVEEEKAGTDRRKPLFDEDSNISEESIVFDRRKGKQLLPKASVKAESLYSVDMTGT